MILVQNPPLPLSGNKLKGYLSIFCLLFLLANSCGSIQSSMSQPKLGLHPLLGRDINPSETRLKHFGGNSQVANIALLLPFNLNTLPADGNAAQAQIESNALVWDFYQGFLLALDSLGRYNLDHNLKGIDLQVMDTGEDTLVLNQILQGGPLDPVDLVIGPLYPNQIKAVTNYSISKNKFFVSPISPQPLSNFNNPNLIMVNSPLEAYSERTANFIQEQYPASNILILETSPQDKAYYGPMLSHFILPPKIIKLNSSQINSGKIPLSTNLNNILVVPSLDKAFWSKLTVFLSSLSPTIPIQVFAHPNFPRLNYGDQDLLQSLHVHYPSTYFMDKDDAATIEMLNLYKSRYQINAGEFSLLGYDVGMFFGKALTSNDSLSTVLLNANWKGIHNDIRFNKEPKLGYWNQSIKMIEYSSNSLVEDK